MGKKHLLSDEFISFEEFEMLECNHHIDRDDGFSKDKERFDDEEMFDEICIDRSFQIDEDFLDGDDDEF